MHGTFEPSARDIGPKPDAGARFETRLLWAALVPLLLLLRPYEGLVQDARIYIGSALADRDPGGIGRDLMFSADGQTEFTLLKPVIRLLLGVFEPSAVSIMLSGLGIGLWLAAVVLLCRQLGSGRIGWAAAVCILALPPDYGSFGTFVYGETVATPRVFAEASVIAALAALVSGRRVPALIALGLAFALHPLMALPGIAIAAAMFAWNDRRWLVPIGGGAVALLVAAALKLPVAGRLFEPIDAAWLTILRARSVNLFPSLWDVGVFAHAAVRAATIVVAASVAPRRLRVLLLATVVVAAGGLGLSALLGDRFPLVLVTQMQTWRALWPLALLGNACFALAFVGLWRQGPAARLALAVLVAAWVFASAPFAIGLAATAVGLRFADLRGALPKITPRLARIVMAIAFCAGALDVVLSAIVLFVYVHAAWTQGGEPLYAAMLVPGVQRWPLVAGALAIMLRSEKAGRVGRALVPLLRSGRGFAMSVIAVSCLLGILLWNGGGSERRLIDSGREATDDLRRLIGPDLGSLLWVDDYSETWFLAGRPAYFSSTQGCPILFSRRLALAWQARGQSLVERGLARQTNLTPWTASDDTGEDAPISREAIEAVCRAPDHPVAIVTLGRHLDAAPPGWPAGLWHPPSPVQYLSGDGEGLRWHKVDSYTVIRCAPAAPVGAALDTQP